MKPRKIDPLSVTCPKCAAKIGYKCVSWSGPFLFRPYHKTHVDRRTLAKVVAARRRA